jgi:sugar phosphate isomerase/epimerase
MKNLEIGICSFSFHRLLAAGKQDIFQYITDCKMLGCTQLDPWNAHLSPIRAGDDVIHAGRNPHDSMHLNSEDDDYIASVKAAADAAGLPFGCIAVDGAHIYEADEAKRAENRARAYRWLDVAHKLGAKQVRIDSGGTEEMPDDQFAIIKEGYRDVIDRAASLGVEVLVENHWGPTRIPANCLKLIQNIEGLGLLLDLHNFNRESRDEGRVLCAPYAKSIHLKSFEFDAEGNEISDEDCVAGLKILLDIGYNGVWGVESMPQDGDEIKGARQTIELIQRTVGAII